MSLCLANVSILMRTFGNLNIGNRVTGFAGYCTPITLRMSKTCVAGIGTLLTPCVTEGSIIGCSDVQSDTRVTQRPRQAAQCYAAEK